MKKSKLLTGLLIGAMCAPLPFVATGCSCSKGNNNFNVNAKDVYAMSALSGATYLSENKTVKASLGVNDNVKNVRPAEITDTDETTVKNCLDMFDDILQGGKVDQTTNKNTSTDDALKKYNFSMTISIPTLDGKNESFVMYYDEVSTETNTEIEDEEEEVETSTTLEGIMLMGDEKFYMEGERTFETEGDESEATIEFITYQGVLDAEGKLLADADLDNANSVKVCQSVENDEIEYEYTIKKDGKIIQETEIEFENEDTEIEIEFQVKSANANETKFKAKKGSDANSFNVSYTKSGKTGSFVVKKETSGYVFEY